MQYKWDDILETALPSEGQGAILRRFFNGDAMTIARVTFSAGAISPVHSHVSEQVALVLSGRMEFTVDGKPVVVAAGEALHLPAHVPHGATALEDSVLFDVFSPPRADWG